MLPQVADAGDGDEYVGAHEGDLALDVTLLVPRVGVAEPRLEAVAEPEPAEELGLPHLVEDPAPRPGRVVEHDDGGLPPCDGRRRRGPDTRTPTRTLGTPGTTTCRGAGTRPRGTASAPCRPRCRSRPRRSRPARFRGTTRGRGSPRGLGPSSRASCRGRTSGPGCTRRRSRRGGARRGSSSRCGAASSRRACRPPVWSRSSACTDPASTAPGRRRREARARSRPRRGTF